MLKPITIAALAALGMGSAHATAVYNFHPTGDGGRYAHVTGGQIKITDAAYNAGHIREDYTYGTDHDGAATSGIISAYLSLASPVGSAGFGPSVGRDFLGIAHAGHGYQLKANLLVGDDGLLDGSLFAASTSDVASANGHGLHWAITGIGSDYLDGNQPCNTNGHGCYGGHGYWQLADDPGDPPAIDTPEPASFGLFGLGLAGIVGLERRRRKASRALALA